MHRYRSEGGFRFINSTPPVDSFWRSTEITDQNVVHPRVPGVHAAPAPVTSEDDLRLIQHGRLPPKVGEQPSSLLLGWQISPATECSSSIYSQHSSSIQDTTWPIRHCYSNKVSRTARSTENIFPHYMSGSTGDRITNYISPPQDKKQPKLFLWRREIEEELKC